MDIVEITNKIVSQSTQRTYTVRDGKRMVKNVYENGFDNNLTKSWMDQYRNAVRDCLNKSGMKNYSVEDLLNDTFRRFFLYVDEKDIVSSRSITCYVFKIIKSLIVTRYRDMNRKKNNQFKYDDDILNYVDDADFATYMDETKYVIDECRTALKNNRFGDRLIDAIIDSDRQIPLSKINHGIYISEAERQDRNTRREICDAWNTIRRIVARDILNQRVDNIKTSKIQYARRS